MARTDSLLKHLLLAFLLALALYLIGFKWLEFRRSRLGPWEVTFVKEPRAVARLVIDQPALRITNVRVEFAGTVDTAPTNARIVFAGARAVPFAVPFGTCVFLDPLFLPGTVTLDLLGHQVEMLPRTLIVDGTEHPWRSAMVVTAGPVTPFEPVREPVINRSPSPPLPAHRSSPAETAR